MLSFIRVTMVIVSLHSNKHWLGHTPTHMPTVWRAHIGSLHSKYRPEGWRLMKSCCPGDLGPSFSSCLNLLAVGSPYGELASILSPPKKGVSWLGSEAFTECSECIIDKSFFGFLQQPPQLPNCACVCLYVCVRMCVCLCLWGLPWVLLLRRPLS